MNKLLQTLLLGLTCCALRPANSDLATQLPEAEVAYSRAGKTDYTVVLLPDIHVSFECHAEIYATLETIKDNIKYLGREGKCDLGQEKTACDVKEAQDYQGTFYSNPHSKDVPREYEHFVQLPIEERISQAQHWASTKMLPSYNSAQTEPVSADILIEAVYQDAFPNVGLEDAKSFVKLNQKVTYGAGVAITRIINQRNRDWVKTIKSHEDTGNGQYVPIVMGRLHLRGLTRLLFLNGISHVVVEHPSCSAEHLAKFASQ